MFDPFTPTRIRRMRGVSRALRLVSCTEGQFLSRLREGDYGSLSPIMRQHTLRHREAWGRPNDPAAGPLHAEYPLLPPLTGYRIHVRLTVRGSCRLQLRWHWEDFHHVFKGADWRFQLGEIRDCLGGNDHVQLLENRVILPSCLDNHARGNAGSFFIPAEQQLLGIPIQFMSMWPIGNTGMLLRLATFSALEHAHNTRVEVVTREP